MLLTDLLFFLLVIVLHELGHYLAFRKYGIKPNIRFNGALLMESDSMFLLRPVQVFFIFCSGILFGLVPFVFYYSYSLFLLYIICCMIDIDAIMDIFSHLEDKRPYYKIVLQDYKEFKKTIRGLLWIKR